MQVSKYTFVDPGYPDSLRQIHSAPNELFVLGELPKAPYVAIVGTRRMSSYGKQVTYQLASELAAAGIVIVSGLAYGLDAVAHQAALDSGGKTIAVLAGNVIDPYPAGHRSLARDILRKGGALVSEHESNDKMHKSRFATRNRIISGLSQAVIITEAPEGSGALLTANYALQQDRLVMVVPGNITSQNSAGPNNLLRKGAIPISCTEDVLNELNYTFSNKVVAAQPKSKDEAKILELLKNGHNTSESLIRASAMEASQFANVITLMEITGKVRNLGAGNWVAR